MSRRVPLEHASLHSPASPGALREGRRGLAPRGRGEATLAARSLRRGFHGRAAHFLVVKVSIGSDPMSFVFEGV